MDTMDAKTSECSSLEQGTVSVTICGAKSLACSSSKKDDRVDAFCSLSLLDFYGEVIKKTNRHTHVIQNQSSPVWNQTFDFQVDAKLESCSGMRIECMNKTGLTSHFIGFANVFFTLNGLKNESFDRWIPLKPKKENKNAIVSGEVRVKVAYCGDCQPSSSQEDSADDVKDHADTHKRLVRYFNMPDDEEILGAFSCNRDSKLGKLYVTTHHIYFLPNGQGRKADINFNDVAEIARKRSGLVFPNALRITAKSGKRFGFGAFVSRDRAFYLLQKQLGKIITQHELCKEKEDFEAEEHEETARKRSRTRLVQYHNETADEEVTRIEDIDSDEVTEQEHTSPRELNPEPREQPQLPDEEAGADMDLPTETEQPVAIESSKEKHRKALRRSRIRASAASQSSDTLNWIRKERERKRQLENKKAMDNDTQQRSQAAEVNQVGEHPSAAGESVKEVNIQTANVDATNSNILALPELRARQREVARDFLIMFISLWIGIQITLWLLPSFVSCSERKDLVALCILLTSFTFIIGPVLSQITTMACVSLFIRSQGKYNEHAHVIGGTILPLCLRPLEHTLLLYLVEWMLPGFRVTGLLSRIVCAVLLNSFNSSYMSQRSLILNGLNFVDDLFQFSAALADFDKLQIVEGHVPLDEEQKH